MLNLNGYKLILASQSPRRHELLKGLGFDFEIRTNRVDESFSPNLKAAAIPEFLAKKKADALRKELADHELLITSDTVVWLGDKVFNKPQSEAEAVEMLTALSGKKHEVITAVCLSTIEAQVVFSDTTKVTFAELEEAEMHWYVSRFHPFDKAGGYGIQEWIGYIAIERIEGSFYNVMGLPTQKLYSQLKLFLNR